MTFFIGVDLHKTQFTVHVRTEYKLAFTFSGATSEEDLIIAEYTEGKL